MALKTVELMEKMTPSQRLGTAKLNNTELWIDVDGWRMEVVLEVQNLSCLIFFAWKYKRLNWVEIWHLQKMESNSVIKKLATKGARG